MKIKKRLVTIASFIIGIILIVGIWAVAATNYGSQSDPLITLSYITDVLTGQITNKVNAQIDTKVTALKTELETRLTQLESANGTGDSAEFTVISLSSGQTLTGNIGTELMLRVGTAVCSAASSPGLIDSTSAEILENGGSMIKNHMYLITINGRGIKATADVMVLVRGQYTIS